MTQRVRLMPKSSRPKSTTSIPEDIRNLFGAFPVLATEDPEAYRAWLERVAEVIKPRNIIEWAWVQDLVYYNWMIRRLRGFAALVIEQERSQLADEEAPSRNHARVIRSKWCSPDEVDTDKGSALAFEFCMDLYGKIDEMIEQAERKRNSVLREIQFYREGLAHLLENLSQKIIDGECEEIAEEK